MKIESIKFKVTASKKMKCNYCKKSLYGNNGFIHIKHGVDYGLGNGLTHTRICWNCLINFLKEAKNDRENREERFRELVKKNIVRNL